MTFGLRERLSLDVAIFFTEFVPSNVRRLFPARAKRPKGAFMINVTGQMTRLTIVNHFREAAKGQDRDFEVG